MQDDYRIRVMLISAGLTVLFGLCAAAIVRFRIKGFPEIFTGAIYGTTAAVMAARCVEAIFHEGILTPESDTTVIHKIYIGTFSFSIVALSLGFLLMTSRALQRILESQALHDPMSGAYRRHAFLELLEREVTTSRRQRRPVTLMMMDLDDFKAINDRHGHPVGDRVIADFAGKVTHLLRRQDVMGRYGGEEFLIMLPGTGIEKGMAIAERIRSRTAEATRKDIPGYTVSIGIACHASGHADIELLIESADK